MVPRCGFYICDNKIKRLVVKIDWNLGFDKSAKHVYVANLYKEFMDKLGDVVPLDVTTASIQEAGRMLSPFNIYVGDKSLEDMWAEAKQGAVVRYGRYEWPIELKREAFAHFYCTYAKDCIPAIKVADVFTDVFYNPTKDGMTQAEPCAMLKMMEQQGELGVLDSVRGYLEWFKTHVDYKED